MAREERNSRRNRDEEDDDRSRKSSRSGYKYQARSKEQVEKRASQSANDFDSIFKDGFQNYKPSKGDNTIRILPPTWEDAQHFGLDIFVHYGIGPDNQSYLCLEKMKGEACPICEELARVKKEGADEDEIKALKPSKRVLVSLIDRDKEKEGPKFWAMSWTMDKDIGKLVVEKKTGKVLPIDDPENGYDIEFSREGEGFKTKYSGLSVSRRESELGNEKWLDFMVENPLPDILNYHDYDHIAKVFGGASPSKKKKDEEEDDSPRSRSSSRSKAKDDDDDLTWDQIHKMEFEELEALIEDKKLKADAEETKDDEELADLICEELDIEKPSKRRSSKEGDEDEPKSRRKAKDEEEDDSPRSRLAKLRKDRD